MPILEDDDLPGRAVYWEAQGVDASGQPVFATPVELRLNWRQKQAQVIGPDGSMLTIDVMATAPQALALDSKVWLAPDPTEDALGQWYATGSAGQTDEVMRVATANKVWDAKGIEVRHTAGLAWFRDAGGAG